MLFSRDDRPERIAVWFRHNSWAGAPEAKTFLADTSGAVTTDFVVLTALVVSLAVAVGVTVGDGVVTSAEKTENCMKRVGRLIMRENIPYEKRLKRIQRQCGRL